MMNRIVDVSALPLEDLIVGLLHYCGILWIPRSAKKRNTRRGKGDIIRVDRPLCNLRTASSVDSVRSGGDAEVRNNRQSLDAKPPI
jgi:hypothetical protein